MKLMDRPLTYNYETDTRSYTPYGPVHMYPGSTTELPQPPRPQRPWGKWTIIAVAATAGAAVIAVSGFVAGSVSTQATTITQTTTVEPEAKPFTASDITWCREYSAQNQRILDNQANAGLPKKMTARDLPASEWTIEDRNANEQFAKVAEAGLADAMVKLQASAQNPVLQMLMNTEMSARKNLMDKIRSATYVPADYALFRSVSSSMIAIGDICDEISRS